MVKFIVNVKLMENKVKSHVGRVIEVKVIIHNKAPGRTVSTLSITRASRPRVEDDSVVSIALRVAAAVRKASCALTKAVGKLAVAASSELTASAVATDMLSRSQG